MALNSENSGAHPSRQSLDDSYHLSKDAENFLGRFVSLAEYDDERTIRPAQADAASLGAVVIHGPSSPRYLTRNPRGVIRELLEPDGSTKQLAEKCVPSEDPRKFRENLMKFGNENFKKVGRALTIEELAQVGLSGMGVEASKRSMYRHAVLISLSRTAVGEFSADVFRETRFFIPTQRH